MCGYLLCIQGEMAKNIYFLMWKACGGVTWLKVRPSCVYTHTTSLH
jgi:hypothetical protein